MLLAGVILILVIFALIGWRKGVIRLVLSLVSMIITIMAAVVIAPLATTAIKNNTNIDENIAQSIYTVLYENKEVDEYFEDKQVLTGGIDISQVESHIQKRMWWLRSGIRLICQRVLRKQLRQCQTLNLCL